MSCCGKILLSDAEFAKTVFVGNTLAFAEALLGRVGIHNRRTRMRRDQCGACSNSTWLTMQELDSWLEARKIYTLQDLLEAKEPLPIKVRQKGRKQFCSICKCGIDAKTCIADMECPIGYW